MNSCRGSHLAQTAPVKDTMTTLGGAVRLLGAGPPPEADAAKQDHNHDRTRPPRHNVLHQNPPGPDTPEQEKPILDESHTHTLH